MEELIVENDESIKRYIRISWHRSFQASRSLKTPSSMDAVAAGTKKYSTLQRSSQLTKTLPKLPICESGTSLVPALLRWIYRVSFESFTAIVQARYLLLK
jgi:hypothetical protein